MCYPSAALGFGSIGEEDMCSMMYSRLGGENVSLYELYQRIEYCS